MKFYCKNTSCGADLTERIAKSLPSCKCGRDIPYGEIYAEDADVAHSALDDSVFEWDDEKQVCPDCDEVLHEAFDDEGDLIGYWCEECEHVVDFHGSIISEEEDAKESFSNPLPDLFDLKKTRPLDVSNPTLKEFTIQLLELLKHREKENLKHLTLFAYPVRQMIENAVKPFEIYAKDLDLFFTSLTRSWDRNKIYFPGDSLTRVNFSTGYKKGFISLVAGIANSRVEPHDFFSNPGKFAGEVWRLFVEIEGNLNEFDRHSKSFQQKTIELESLQKIDTQLFCYSCNSSHRLKTGLLSAEHIPAKGLCSDCKSSKHTTFLVTQDDKLTSSPIIFDSISEQFFISLSNEEKRVDLMEVWEEYQRTGTIDSVDFNPGEPAESMADLLNIELKLHNSAAEMYAKLRGIPVTNPNNTLKSKGLLRDLEWLNEQVKQFVEKVEKN